MRRLACSILLASLLSLPASGASRKRPHGKSPHAEITAEARVETPPQRRIHKNRRQFEELDVTILSARRAPQGREGGDPDLSIDRSNRVHIVHDLTCGGDWVELKPGDRVEIQGEYVHPPHGPDLIHFTHEASGACGASGGHPDGYLRPSRPNAAADSGEKTPPAEDLFATTLRPVLARRCAPCHERGGKMYARLPFDDPAVLSSHADGARRRLKGDDLATLERWLASLSVNPKS